MRNFHVPSLGRAGISTTLNYLKEQGLSLNTHIWVYAEQEKEYRDNYPEMNIHVLNFPDGRNLTRKRNMIIDFITESGESGMMLDDDINQFIIGKTKYSDFKVVKTLDFALVYDLLERASILCEDVVSFSTKRNFITTYTHTERSLFTKFSVASGLIFFTGRNMKSRADEATKADDICLATECWLNKELDLKFNLIYAKFSFGTNAGGLQSGSTDFNASTKKRLEDEHKFMVEKYNNECTYTVNEKTGYFGSNGTKVRKWLLDTGKYTEEEMRDLDAKIKSYSEKVYNDEIFNDILSKVHNNKWNII
ncbi:MAG: hypothetical protein IJF92_00255 [Bacilli bacterium]|nr:hypothetical protein [Bacilli bacterium]MBQ3307581.1 hypothetical protein [Bacilli bacterium]MBQ3422569.1 hypothetical protein [Romboutsia sp.]